MVTQETKWGRVEVDEQMPRWNAELGKMTGSVRYKATKLNRLKKIRECATPNNYIIEPTKGYNKTFYLVDIKAETCNCQYNKNGKTGKLCAHIMGVHLFIMNKG